MGSWTQIRRREDVGRGAARLSEELINTPPTLFWSSQQEVKEFLGQEVGFRKQRSEDLGLLQGTLGNMF